MAIMWVPAPPARQLVSDAGDHQRRREEAPRDLERFAATLAVNHTLPLLDLPEPGERASVELDRRRSADQRRSS